MDPRLLPLNAFIGLCANDHLWPAPLAELGYRIRGIEIPVRAGDERVVVDAVAFRDETRALLAAESKSGKNVSKPQARAYVNIQPENLIRASRVTVTTTGPVSCQPVYVCLQENVDRILMGLQRAEAPIPVMALDGDRVATVGPTFGDSDLERLRTPARFPEGAIPRYIPVDAESPPAAFDAHVLAALVAKMSHRRPQVEISFLAHDAFPYLAMYGETAKQRILHLVDGAARRIADANSESFLYSPKTGTRKVAVVEILRAPEDADLRGRTQSYQAISRAAGKRGVRRRELEGQQSLDDIVAELNQAAEAPDSEDEVDD